MESARGRSGDRARARGARAARYLERVPATGCAAPTRAGWPATARLDERAVAAASAGARCLAAALGCRRDVELTVPARLPMVACAAERRRPAAAAATAAREPARDGRCAPAACRAEGAAVRRGADCCSFLCAPIRPGRARASAPPGRLRLRRADLRARRRLLLARLQRRRLRRRRARRAGRPCATAGDCCGGVCMGGVCAAAPGCRPAGEACAGRRLLRARLRRPRRERRRDLPAARRLPRRRRDLHVGRRLLQRAVHEPCPGGGMRCQALPGCRPGSRAVHDRQGLLLGPLRAVGRRPEPLRRAAGCQPRAGALRRPTATAARARARSGPRRRPLREAVARDGRHCRPLGELCMKADECCAGADAAAPTPTGRMRCLPAGGGLRRRRLSPAPSRDAVLRRSLPARRPRRVRVPRRLRAARRDLRRDRGLLRRACVGPPGASGLRRRSTRRRRPPICTPPGDPCDPLAAACCAGTVCAEVAGGAHACAPARRLSESRGN